MAKRIRDTNLESKSAREKLKPRGDPYYKTIDRGLHVGFRKGKKAGVWVMRTYAGDQKYVVETIGLADDNQDADGGSVLDWWQAVDRARALVAERATAKHETPAGPYTVSNALDDYLAHAKERQKSYRSTVYSVEEHIRPEFGQTAVMDLTASQIRDWHNKLASTPPRLRTRKGKEQKYAKVDMTEDVRRQRKSTANRVMTTLKAALNLAFREGKVADDKEWRRVESFEDVDSARVHYLTIAEAQRLVNACGPDFRKLVQAALQTGCRYGELCRLRVGDFNPTVGTLTIRMSKTSQSRHIVLTEEGIEFFKTITAGRPSDAVMLRKENGEAWGESHQSRPMIDACKRAKISPAIGLHGLRHTWASLAVMNGVPMMVVAKNLGHVDTRMVEKHYGHLAPSYVADAIRAGAPRFGTVEKSNVQAIN